MAPSSHQVCAQLRQMIYYHLDNNLLENAQFLASRLYALDQRNPDAIYLLGLCHFRLSEFRAALDCCRIAALRGAHLGCAYVFAQSCLQLEKYQDGISALEKSRGLWAEKVQNDLAKESRRQRLPDSAAVYCLLGKLFQGNMDAKRAVECYADALRLNPLMWDAFERLCDFGTHLRPENVFKVNADILDLLSSAQDQSKLDDELPRSSVPLQSQPPNSFLMSTPGCDPFSNGTKDTGLSTGGGNLASRMNIGVSHEAQSPQSNVRSEHVLPNEVAPLQHGIAPPNAPIRKTRPVTSFSSNNMTSSNQTTAPSVNTSTFRRRAKAGSDEVVEAPEMRKAASISLHQKRTISGSVTSQSASSIPQDTSSGPQQQRRSVRLFHQKDRVPSAIGSIRENPELRKVKPTGTRGRIANAATVGRVVSGNRKLGDVSEVSVKDQRSSAVHLEPNTLSERMVNGQAERSLESAEYLIELIGKLGQGYYALSQFDCSAALQHFLNLPTQQKETPWVLAQIGKAYYEQSNYLEAERTFARIKKLAPSRMEDMEIYSTVLWHLKNDTELAFLAHELVQTDRMSPQAWCTIGNAFSLQREHDQALKCFKRATQLDPKFAYGFTLQGHEHVANEEYDKALGAYRKAICADRRHYNGWYGLAKVYEKQGKYAEAKEHYGRAASINPNNAILVCCKGMALEKLKSPQMALREYELACQINPQSAVARFRKARVLLNLGRMHGALEECMILKDLVPDESNVHFMLGRVYKLMRNKTNAIRHYTIALNLDPKAAPYIKEAMESLDEEIDLIDDEDDTMV